MWYLSPPGGHDWYRRFNQPLFFSPLQFEDLSFEHKYRKLNDNKQATFLEILKKKLGF